MTWFECIFFWSDSILELFYILLLSMFWRIKEEFLTYGCFQCEIYLYFVGFPNDWQTSKKSYFFGNPRHLLTCEGRSHSRYSQGFLRVTFSVAQFPFFCWKIYFIDIFCQCQERGKKDFYPENAYSESVFWETKKDYTLLPYS